MTKNMISELIRTMDGMYRLMSLQQKFLERAAERLNEGNRETEEYQEMLEERDREIEEYQEMLEERDREIEEYQEMMREKDLQIEDLRERIGNYQRLNTRLNEENRHFVKQNQELLNLKSD